ncbi:GerW family sporulation protein [Fervidibacillus halotolerans]|uniref:GerW family sporulation protein n=1 Tax=Fervidibacillus halotolerans TaxID=2980027 RepID=A0A9E8RXF3_9BACI|nr:GerW family sporulation protein [Fervidibacillus halotolerans]WAA11686.1 GerW family sporulation protein [Fervidibacillus halotolerans]
MSEHPIQGLMMTAMENLKEMIDVNTIIGDPIETADGSVILAVSKVSFGFAAGGSQFFVEGASSQSENGELPFGGGSGGGVSIKPIAFLIVNSQGVKMLHMDEGTHLYEKLFDLVPNMVEKIQQMMSDNAQKKGKQSENKNDSQGKSDQKEDAPI